MARCYDVVCLECGEILTWYKYDDPMDSCPVCETILSDGSEWDTDAATVFGPWSTSDEVAELSEKIRNERRGYDRDHVRY